MLKNKMLIITPAIKDRVVQIGESMEIRTLPDSVLFTTKVLEEGNKLQARGAIGRFYTDQEVRVGDSVILTEIDYGR